VLTTVTAAVKSEFLTKVAQWLPGKSLDLLYRGSRDGMTPKAFHDRCDGKGPTLVLVTAQSTGKPVCVFGGYAGKSWASGKDVWVASPDSFVFTVQNTFDDGIVKMPLIRADSEKVLFCDTVWGPTFGDGFTFSMGNSARSATVVYDTAWSYCGMNPDGRGVFGDPLGHARETFTGAQDYAVQEVEVFRVY
jgi:hypothetical protein